MSETDIRVVVAIDFGTTFSGFAYAHKATKEIETNERWPGREGLPKTNTAILYDSAFTVKEWGEPALVEAPAKKKKNAEKFHTVELFKLHLTNMNKKDKPFLPPEVTFKKAISDYLREMNKVIEETLDKTWNMETSQVLYIMTIPAEWHDNTKAILRQCALEAGVIDILRSQRLEFTTEPEAAAIHCLNYVPEHNLKTGDAFLVVDCGGGTVDLTVRSLRDGGKLGEITERTGGLCGSTFVDKEFLKFLGTKLGMEAIVKFKTEYYPQLQYLIQKFFCPRVKFTFTGDKDKFRKIDLDLEQYCPALTRLVSDEVRENMEDEDWIITIDFDSVKAMFDPVVNHVMRLIEDQLKSAAPVKAPAAMFLVGGFSESIYLRKQIRETFSERVPNINVPRHPMASVVKGAVAYGLSIETITERVINTTAKTKTETKTRLNTLIETRTLKWDYGIEILTPWVKGDQKKRRTADGRVAKFFLLASRNQEVHVNKKFSAEFKPVFKEQTAAVFKVYSRTTSNIKYCNQAGVRLLGELHLDLPDVRFGLDRPIEFTLTFGMMELKAAARNKRTGEEYRTSWVVNQF